MKIWEHEQSDFGLAVRLATNYRWCWQKLCQHSEGMSPMVLVERNGRIELAAVAPNQSRESGLTLAGALALAFRPHVLTAVFDAFTTTPMSVPPGTDIEEAHAIFRQQYPPGGLKTRYEQEGGDGRGQVSDCLTFCRVDRRKNVFTATLPYRMHGREIAYRFDNLTFHSSDQGRAIGLIPETLKKFMVTKNVSNGDSGLAQFLGISQTKPQSVRDAMIAYLHKMKCLLWVGTEIDCLLNPIFLRYLISDSERFHQFAASRRRP